MMASDRDQGSQGDASLGGEERFRGLYTRYYRPVVSFFARRGFSPEDSRDLTQETFFRAYLGMARLRGDTSAETWIFTIAANLYRNELRSRTAAKRGGREVGLHRLRGGEAAPAEGGEERPEVLGQPRNPVVTSQKTAPDLQALEQERIRRLREAMADLPPQMRRCVALRVDQELKYREIADTMKISIQTVKSQLHQARERLRDALADIFSDIEFN